MRLAENITSVITNGRVILESIAEDSLYVGGKDRWSHKEILGHLIDSAINNRRRFIKYQIVGKLIFDGYDQDGWVTFSDYDSWSWQDLIDGWFIRNKEMASLVSYIPKEVLQVESVNHNLYDVAFKTVEKGKPSSLQYFIIDYLAHMEHHLYQISDSYIRIVREY